VEIRHAEAGRDAVACAAIYAPFVAEGVASFEETAPDGEEFARRIESVSAEYPWLVAEQDGVAAGYAYACRHRERAAYRWTCEVTIYLADGFRGRGIGKQLYRTLFDLLARQGLRTALAGITLPNDASVGLHESCGFQLVGIYRNIGYKAGQWRDVGWWQLELPAANEDPPPDPGPPPRLGDP
jgi:L-amino acid N-acyltransferase YncA